MPPLIRRLAAGMRAYMQAKSMYWRIDYRQYTRSAGSFSFFAVAGLTGIVCLGKHFLIHLYKVRHAIEKESMLMLLQPPP
ncbi:hypothetical protein FHS20_004056 [Phyllobacterium endophyticum]|uniref:Uncharacterized protein n=1 Tax=Phyllobacterium endophyticum TaxID=1149773 RepID=A0A2P7AK88_9HYPH|nr:hypothetical protein [Phyllobacterium endophyticum]PSH54620.1 hypothetical protein CU100_25915 [Phyllobacterium endophyticum]